MNGSQSYFFLDPSIFLIHKKDQKSNLEKSIKQKISLGSERQREPKQSEGTHNNIRTPDFYYTYFFHQEKKLALPNVDKQKLQQFIFTSLFWL